MILTGLAVLMALAVPHIRRMLSVPDPGRRGRTPVPRTQGAVTS
jgi:hypothetical protein